MATAETDNPDHKLFSSNFIDLTADDEDEEPPVLPKPTFTVASIPPSDSQVSDADVSEIDSMYEDLLDGIADEDFVAENDACTLAEARLFRQKLREDGPQKFILETITRRQISARKLCTAFRVEPPAFLEGAPDEAYLPLLGQLIKRELLQRQRLPQYKSIDDAVHLLQTAKKIIVITGAGISTSLGIPDFRSKHSGFYSKLQRMGYDDPQEVFDLARFDEDPSLFFSLAGDIIPDLHKWSPTHEFIRLLQTKDKLLTNYTQNIDNLEGFAGIDPAKLVQCHGSWATATCRKCKFQVPGETLFEDVKAHKVSYCKRCQEDLLKVRPAAPKRKRSSNGSKSRKRRPFDDDDSDSDGAYDIPQPGVMKPDITFFGEALPDKFFHRLKKEDRFEVDLVVVIGTSMKVAPVSEIPNFIESHVPCIYISREPVKHIEFDINLIGDCDHVVTELCRRAEWSLSHEMIPENFKVAVEKDQERDYQTSVRLISLDNFGAYGVEQENRFTRKHH